MSERRPPARLLIPLAACTAVTVAGATGVTTLRHLTATGAPVSAPGVRHGDDTSSRQAALAGSGSRPTTTLVTTTRPGTDESAAFAPPVFLDGSGRHAEPRIAIDGRGAIHVVAPQPPDAVGGQVRPPGVTGGTLAWTSTDGGTSFTGPVTATAIAGRQSDRGGRTSDVAVDGGGRVYASSSWLGNTSLSVSEDGGDTWFGVPAAHAAPVDDHSWLAYDPHSDSLYMTWTGADGVHVGRALLRGRSGQVADSLVMVQDVLAVPQIPVQGLGPIDGLPVKEGLPPAGAIATGPDGRVLVVFPRGNLDGAGAVGIAESADSGLTWTLSAVPGSGRVNSPQSVDYNLQRVAIDNLGNAYVVWAESPSTDQAPAVYYSWRAAGATAWHAPVPVSVSRSALMPELAVVSPGVIDVAYYGTDAYTGDPNAAPAATGWTLYLSQVRRALAGDDIVTVPVLRPAYRGALCAQLIEESCATSFGQLAGEYFGLAVDRQGMARIVAVLSRATELPAIAVVRQSAPLLPTAAPAGPTLQSVIAALRRPVAAPPPLLRLLQPAPGTAAATPATRVTTAVRRGVLGKGRPKLPPLAGTFAGAHDLVDRFSLMPSPALAWLLVLAAVLTCGAAARRRLR